MVFQVANLVSDGLDSLGFKFHRRVALTTETRPLCEMPEKLNGYNQVDNRSAVDLQVLITGTDTTEMEEIYPLVN